MKHPLTFLLRVGRSETERTSLLGDLEEEGRARLARGSRRLVVFAWYTAELLRALAWGIRDTFARLTHLRRGHDGQTWHGRLASFLSWPDIKLSLRLLVQSPGLTVGSTVG